MYCKLNKVVICTEDDKKNNENITYLPCFSLSFYCLYPVNKDVFKVRQLCGWLSSLDL